MVHLDRVEWRVQAGIWEWPVEYDRCGGGPRCDGKRLYAEAADKPLMSSPVLVGLNISLIPGDTKMCLGNVDDEEVFLMTEGCRTRESRAVRRRDAAPSRGRPGRCGRGRLGTSTVPGLTSNKSSAIAGTKSNPKGVIE